MTRQYLLFIFAFTHTSIKHLKLRNRFRKLKLFIGCAPPLLLFYLPCLSNTNKWTEVGIRVPAKPPSSRFGCGAHLAASVSVVLCNAANSKHHTGYLRFVLYHYHTALVFYYNWDEVLSNDRYFYSQVQILFIRRKNYLLKCPSLLKKITYLLFELPLPLKGWRNRHPANFTCSS